MLKCSQRVAYLLLIRSVQIDKSIVCSDIKAVCATCSSRKVKSLRNVTALHAGTQGATHKTTKFCFGDNLLNKVNLVH